MEPDIQAEVPDGGPVDFDATVFGPRIPPIVIRRVGGTCYVGNKNVEVPPVDADELEPGAGGALRSFLAWNALRDLRAALEGAGQVERGTGRINGAAVTSYTFDF